MMQVLFRVPGLNVPVHGFGVMVALAYALGLLTAVRRARREGLDTLVIQDLGAAGIIGGLAGARLFYVAEYWGETIHSVREALRVWEGGLVFYGGVIGATAAFFLLRLFRRFPVLATLDAVAPSLALGVAVGRLGCFLNGCCYGDFCSSPWLGVRFPKGSPPWLAERAQGLLPPDAPWSLPLHPTQLYSAADGLLLFAVLTLFYPLRRRDGEVVGLLMLTYPVSRFLIERLRNDETPVLGWMTVAQVVSLLLLLFGLLFWSRLAGRPARPPAGAAPVSGAG
jgi:phosphatidylglycerol:prolipoprotein diacylglycerol transferase